MKSSTDVHPSQNRPRVSFAKTHTGSVARSTSSTTSVHSDPDAKVLRHKNDNKTVSTSTVLRENSTTKVPSTQSKHQINKKEELGKRAQMKQSSIGGTALRKTTKPDPAPLPNASRQSRSAKTYAPGSNTIRSSKPDTSSKLQSKGIVNMQEPKAGSPREGLCDKTKINHPANPAPSSQNPLEAEDNDAMEDILNSLNPPRLASESPIEVGSSLEEDGCSSLGGGSCTFSSPPSVLRPGRRVQPGGGDVADQASESRTAGGVWMRGSVTASIRGSLAVSSSKQWWAGAETRSSVGVRSEEYSPANSQDLLEFEEFTREVAVRVIQYYWRSYKSKVLDCQTTDPSKQKVVSPDKTSNLVSQLIEESSAPNHLGQTLDQSADTPPKISSDAQDLDANSIDQLRGSFSRVLSPRDQSNENPSNNLREFTTERPPSHPSIPTATSLGRSSSGGLELRNKTALGVRSSQADKSELSAILNEIGNSEGLSLKDSMTGQSCRSGKRVSVANRSAETMSTYTSSTSLHSGLLDQPNSGMESARNDLHTLSVELFTGGTDGEKESNYLTQALRESDAREESGKEHEVLEERDRESPIGVKHLVTAKPAPLDEDEDDELMKDPFRASGELTAILAESVSPDSSHISQSSAANQGRRLVTKKSNLTVGSGTRGQNNTNAKAELASRQATSAEIKQVVSESDGELIQAQTAVDQVTRRQTIEGTHANVSSPVRRKIFEWDDDASDPLMQPDDASDPLMQPEAAPNSKCSGDLGERTSAADKLSSIFSFLDAAESSHEPIDGDPLFAIPQGHIPNASSAHPNSASLAQLSRVPHPTPSDGGASTFRSDAHASSVGVRHMSVSHAGSPTLPDPCQGSRAHQIQTVADHSKPVIPKTIARSSGRNFGEDSVFENESLATSSLGDDSTSLANTVFDGVKSKIKELRKQVAEKEKRIEEQQAELVEAETREGVLREEVERRVSVAAEEQRAEGERQQARLLAFIDRLLADKDQLTSKCTHLAQQIAEGDQRAESSKVAMSSQWSAELKRQKEQWEQAEKVRREAWMAEKTKEVKELTIRGLEPEIQRLVAKHKAEVRRVEGRQQEELRRQHDELSVQHEQYSRGLRERLLKEREDAVEKERLAAQARLRDQAERYESQVQSQRVRLGCEGEATVERLEAARREDKARHEEALSRVKKEAETREEEIRREVTMEVEELKRKHWSEVRETKAKVEAEQEAFRVQLQTKAKQELQSRETALRSRLESERDAQLEAVVSRLEEESRDQRVKDQETRTRELEEAKNAHRIAEEELREVNSKLQAQCTRALEAEKEMSGKLSASESHLGHLRKELEGKGETLAWMEKTLSTAQADLATRDQDLRAVFVEKENLLKQKARNLEEEHSALQRRFEAVNSDLEGLRRRKESELEAVEARVRAAMERKDETIATLRTQKDQALQQLRHTEQVLQRHQEAILRNSND